MPIQFNLELIERLPFPPASAVILPVRRTLIFPIGATMKFTARLLSVMTCVALIIGISGAIPGCTAQQLDQLQQEKQTVDQELADAQQQLAALQSSAATQPTTASAQKAVADAQAVVEKAQQASTALQGVIGELQSGNLGGSATASALALIPGVGPYASLIAAGVGLVYGLWQRQQKINQANQLAAAVHADAGSSNVVQTLTSLGYTAPAQQAPATAGSTAGATASGATASGAMPSGAAAPTTS
jgi:hypothetical protein